jgi:hypothetical protein
MNASALCGLALASLATMASAEVVIYRAVCRITYDIEGDKMVQAPAKSSAYIVVDYDAGTWSRFNYYTESGKRVFSANGVVFNFKGGNAALPNGKTASVFADGGSSENGAESSHHLTTLRGLNVPFVIATQPGAVTVTRPRAGTLIDRLYDVSPGSAEFYERTYTLTFDPARTIKANNAQLSVADAMNAIISEFAAKGYVPDEN